MNNYLPLSSIKYSKIYQYHNAAKSINTYKGFGVELNSENGYYHKFVDFNKFELKKTKIPKTWTKKVVNSRQVKCRFCNKNSKLLLIDNEFIKQIREENVGATTYFVHDNGNRPFLVYCGEIHVRVYKMLPNQDEDYYLEVREWNEAYYIKCVFECNMTDVKKLFIGEDDYRNDFKGNTVLIVLNCGTCVSVGNRGIYQFDLDVNDNEEILEYYSPVGNSDVPYPYAVSTKNKYFIVEQCCVPVQFFQGLTGDPYMYLYGHSGGKDNVVMKNKQQLTNMIQLVKRNL